MFQDRLVSPEDRDWFDKLLQDRIEEFGCSFQEVVPYQPVLFGDFMNPGSENKAYQLIDDREKVGNDLFLSLLFQYYLFTQDNILKRVFSRAQIV